MFRSIRPSSTLSASLTALSTSALWTVPSQYRVTYRGMNVYGERISASSQAAAEG